MFENLFEVSYRADVVAATCVGAGDAILDGRCFQLCVIDEATQVSCNSTAPFIATYPRLTSNFIRSCAVF
jgi:superfamily I DNA and/or RNA helicase